MLVIKQYFCETCGGFEELQNHKEIHSRCPKCDSLEIERVITPSLVVDKTPRTVGSMIEQNNRRNPLTREKLFGVGAEKKIKAQEKMKKISELSPQGIKSYVEKGIL